MSFAIFLHKICVSPYSYVANAEAVFHPSSGTCIELELERTCVESEIYTRTKHVANPQINFSISVAILYSIFQLKKILCDYQFKNLRVFQLSYKIP